MLLEKKRPSIPQKVGSKRSSKNQEEKVQDELPLEKIRPQGNRTSNVNTGLVQTKSLGNGIELVITGKKREEKKKSKA